MYVTDIDLKGNVPSSLVKVLVLSSFFVVIVVDGDSSNYSLA